MENKTSLKVSKGSFLIKGNFKLAIDIAKEKTDVPVIYITRNDPSHLDTLNNASSVWLGSNKDRQINDLGKIYAITEEFTSSNKECMILMDRIDYLITLHGFSETLKLIYNINDLASKSNITFLLNIKPSLLDQHQIRLIEEEIKNIPLETSNTSDIGFDLKDILEFVKIRSDKGSRTTYKDITKEFSITKTTARKRINRLIYLGLINIKKSGRFKILQLNREF